MCFGTEPFLYCWCSLNKKGSIIFDEDDNDSNDDHDNVLKEKKRFLHVLFELNQKKLWNKADELYTTRKNVVVWTVCEIDVLLS